MAVQLYYRRWGGGGIEWKTMQFYSQVSQRADKRDTLPGDPQRQQAKSQDAGDVGQQVSNTFRSGSRSEDNPKSGEALRFSQEKKFFETETKTNTLQPEHFFTCKIGAGENRDRKRTHSCDPDTTTKRLFHRLKTLEFPPPVLQSQVPTTSGGW